MIAVLVLGYVTLARVAELLVAWRNTRDLLARGGQEHASEHYPAIVAFHTLWLVCLWLMAPGRPVVIGWLIVFGLLQPLRIWVIGALGARWTARIIIVPGETLMRRGPYRFMHHPNYAVVIGEIASLPLAFGLWPLALVSSAVNGALLVVRIRAENAALATVR
jgi:methyltransferase